MENLDRSMALILGGVMVAMFPVMAVPGVSIEFRFVGGIVLAICWFGIVGVLLYGIWKGKS